MQVRQGPYKRKRRALGFQNTFHVSRRPGREDDWQTRRRPDGTLRLANRCVALIPTIPAENPEPKGTPSAMYKPDWIDPELGESIEESDEQEAIQEGLF